MATLRSTYPELAQLPVERYLAQLTSDTLYACLPAMDDYYSTALPIWQVLQNSKIDIDAHTEVLQILELDWIYYFWEALSPGFHSYRFLIHQGIHG